MVCLPHLPQAALLGRARDDLADPFQVAGQLLPARMSAARLSGSVVLRWRRLERLAFALGLNLLARYARLQVKQLKLQIAQRLAALAIPGDAVQAKALFQNLDLDLGQGQRLILAGQQLISACDLLVPFRNLRMKLRDDLGQYRIGLRHGLRGQVHDVL